MRTITLMYHDIISPGRPDGSGFPGPGAASFKVEFTRFEEHLDAITRSATPWALRSAGDGRCTVRDGWCLTFDDGGVSALSLVAEALERRAWRGVFFVATDFIGQPGFLEGEQIRELHARGHIVGSHTRTHPPKLSACTRDSIAAEWRDSLDVLAHIIGAPVVFASVPNGSYDRIVGEEAAKAGIQALFTSNPSRHQGRIADCSVLGRYNVRATTSAAWVAAVTAGAPWPRYLQWLEWKVKRLAEDLAGKQFLWARRRWHAARNR